MMNKILQLDALDTNEVVYNYQNYGATVAVKRGLCKAIKAAYSHFMISFIDSYNNVSLKTSIVDSNNYNTVIVDSSEFTEILEKYFYNIAPGTNSEVGAALLNTINEFFIRCIDYAERQVSYYYNF